MKLGKRQTGPKTTMRTRTRANGHKHQTVASLKAAVYGARFLEIEAFRKGFIRGYLSKGKEPCAMLDKLSKADAEALFHWAAR